MTRQGPRQAEARCDRAPSRWQWVPILCLALASLLSGCESAEWKDVKAVATTLQCEGSRGAAQTFGTGMLEGGRAVLYAQQDAAYWVQNGRAYFVNEAAHRLSLGLVQAPDNITYEAVLGAVDAVPGSTGMDSSDYLIRGGRLTQEEVTALESKIVQQSDDLETRRLLLCYYSSAQYRSPEAREKHAELALWFIRNWPKDLIAGSTEAWLDPVLDGAAYTQARALWAQEVKQNPTDLIILSHAADFSQIHDPDFAESCLKKCIEVTPTQPEWHKKLAHFYALHADGGSPEALVRTTKALAEIETVMAMIKYPEERSDLLEDAAQYAYNASEYGKAKTYATELLGGVGVWNRSDNGNAIHYGNIVLGRLALRGGDVASAKRHLIEAGKTPGSPDLDSFGPSMDLAKELLEKGERSVVLEYLDLCNKFWDASCQDTNEGEKSIPSWKRIIAEGGIPEF